jgi:hypothetical protein
MPNSRNPPSRNPASWWEEQRTVALTELDSLTEAQLRDILRQALGASDTTDALTTLTGSTCGHAEFNKHTTQQGEQAGAAEAAKHCRYWAEGRRWRPSCSSATAKRVAQDCYRMLYGEAETGKRPWIDGFARGYQAYVQQRLPGPLWTKNTK